MQMPLVSIAFLEDNPEDLKFKKSIDGLYKALANKKARKVQSLVELIAPFIVMTGLIPAIPAGDNVLTKTKPVGIANQSIIIFCCLVFILQNAFAYSLLLSNTGLDYFTSSFALIKSRVFSYGEWYRLITYAFLHGGILHLFFNMVFLRVFSRAVEDELGWKKYLFLFALGAVFSAIFTIATISKSDIPCIGASGAISAIIGAYLILFPWAKLRFNLIHPLTFQKLASTEVPSMYYILSWIIMNIFFGMLQSGGKTSGIAYWGHIGGFVTGVIFAEVYKNLKRG
jgi:membrane associated rhomboid family serine protease